MKEVGKCLFVYSVLGKKQVVFVDFFDGGCLKRNTRRSSCARTFHIEGEVFLKSCISACGRLDPSFLFSLRIRLAYFIRYSLRHDSDIVQRIFR